MAEEKILMYKGHPLMRKGNLLYYGSMADSHIVMLQILETKEVNGEPIASRVAIQLQLTDPNVKGRDGWSRRAKRPDCTPHWISAASGWNGRWLASKKASPKRQTASSGNFLRIFQISSSFSFSRRLRRSEKVSGRLLTSRNSAEG